MSESKKPVGYSEKKEAMRPISMTCPASPTGGVKPMSIQGRLYRERERLAGSGMTDKERQWRAQWIRDQVLSKNEPKEVPEIYQKLYNPIRRFYRYPMNNVEKFLTRNCQLGPTAAASIRFIVVQSFFGLIGVYSAFYYFKYNANDWTRKGGWRVVRNRPSVDPGDPDWPYKPERTVGADYANHGFKASPIQKPLVLPETNETVNLSKADSEEDIESSSKELEEILKLFPGKEI